MGTFWARDLAPSFFAGGAKEYGIVVASPLEFRGFRALESCKKAWAEMTKLEQIADGQTDALGDNIGLTAACFHGHRHRART